MGSTDWRSPDAYEELRVLDAPGFAWEYLRRNPWYLAERAELQEADRQGTLDQARTDDFARRWGVRFREGRGRRRRRRAEVDPRRATHHRRARERPGRDSEPRLSATQSRTGETRRVYRRRA